MDVVEQNQTEEALKRRIAELTALNRVTQLIHASVSKEEMVQGVMDGLIHSLTPDLVVLYLLEDREMVVQDIHAPELVFPKEEELQHRFGDCLCGLTAESGESLFSLNIHDDSRCTNPECKLAGIISFATAALRLEREVIGVLALGSKRKRDFHEHREFIESVAAVTSIGFHKRHLFESMARHAEELEERVRQRTSDLDAANRQLQKDVQQRDYAEKTIRKNEARLQALMNIDLMKEASEKELIQYAVDELVTLTDSEIGYLHFITAEEQEVSPFVWSERVKATCESAGDDRFPLAKSDLLAESLRERKPIINNDYANTVGRAPLPPGHVPLTRFMNVPILDGESLVAIAGVGNKQDPYDDFDVLQLSLFGGNLWDAIKQRRRDEENRKLLSAVERSPASIVITDREGRISYVNPFFSQITGYQAREAIGQTPAILKSGYHSRAYYRELWEVLDAGDTWRGEFCNKTKDGRIYWEDASIAPVFDEKGVIKNYIAVKEDITSRKKYEEEVKTALSEFETIFNNSSVAIAYFKQDRIFHRINERFAQLFHCRPEDMIGKSSELLHVSHENYLDFGKKYVESLAHGGVIQAEYQMRRQDGDIIWCFLYGKAINPPHLEDGVIWVLDDITERKELEMLREDVERIMRHDLKTPLNGIIGLPQLLMPDTNLTNEQRECLQLIEESGYRMLHQINLSLDLFKMETGQYHFDPNPVDLGKMIAKLLKELGTAANDRGISIVTFIKNIPLSQAEPFLVQADEMLSLTMLSNLINNAIEASGPGDRILIRLDEKDDRAFVSIHNKQPVPLAIRDHFFDKYSTSGKEKGTGLGTYSAKLMAETQRGDIHMETSETTGTTITVYFQT